MSKPNGLIPRILRYLFGGEPAGDTAPPRRTMDSCPYCGAGLASAKVLGTSHRGKVHADIRTWRCGTVIRRHFFREEEITIGDKCNTLNNGNTDTTM